MTHTNQGYAAGEIEALRNEMSENGNLFVYKEDYEPNEEFAEFLFIGAHEGQPVVYDCMLFLLTLAYENKLLGAAEELALAHNPAWKDVIEEGNEDHYPEELEDFMAYAIIELEEDERIKVQESLEFDFDFEYGIGLEVSLNLEAITPTAINQFVSEFNKGTLELDTTLYAFEEEEDDED